MPVVSSGAGSQSDPTSLANKPPKPGPDLFVATARMYEKSGKPDLAKEQYEKALKADPKFLPALLGMAQFRDNQREYTEADKLYDRAVKANPQEAAVYNDLALSRQHRGQLDEARQAMARAIALQPDKKLYRNNMASILVDMNQPEAAYKELVAAHGPAVGHYNLAIMLHRKGDDGAARYQFAQAAEVEPSLVAAREWARRLGPNDAAMQNQVAAQTMNAPIAQVAAEQPIGPRPMLTNVMPLPEQVPLSDATVVTPVYGMRYAERAAATPDEATAPMPDQIDQPIQLTGLQRLPPTQ
jgi:tetratricopeptide (TPR) repeat protein